MGPSSSMKIAPGTDSHGTVENSILGSPSYEFMRLCPGRRSFQNECYQAVFLRGFSASPQATTWSNMVFNDASLEAAGANVRKFSKSVERER